MSKKRILIADDDPAVCKVLSRVLTSKGMAPHIATNGADALARLTSEPFDVVVLDIKMDEMDGFEVLERMRGAGIDVPVIILSGNSENYNMLLGLESGADDYMTKPFDPSFLAAKIQAVLRREQRKKSHNTDMRVRDLRYNAAGKRLRIQEEDVSLSAKEHALLKLFMENPGRVYSKEELYTLIWCDGTPPEKTDENTVMVHINRLRNKIEADARNPEYIQTVWGVGYKMNPEAQ